MQNPKGHQRMKNKIFCNKCNNRYVKISPKSCLDNEDYLSCHKLCRPCWKQDQWKNYGEDTDKLKQFKHCFSCHSQPCYYCKYGLGTWYPEYHKSICSSCL